MRYINKNIISLSFISLLDDFAYELVITILPAFLISINASPAIFGLILGIPNFFSFLKILFGRLSDKYRSRKIFTILGYSLTSIHFFILQLINSWIGIFFSWVISGIGKSIREPSRNALLIESTEKKYYGRVFGFHRTFDSLGSIFGPALALILINKISVYKIFSLSFLLSFLALLILILSVTETKNILI